MIHVNGKDITTGIKLSKNINIRCVDHSYNLKLGNFEI